MQANLRASLSGMIAAIALALGATVCTTFNGLEAASAVDGGIVVGSDAGDGAADAGVPGYLPVAKAAKVCSTIFACPELARSIVYSMAIPVDGLNYSLCVDWLAGPIPPSRVGFGLQASTLECVAKADTCEQAGACLWVEYLAPNDPRCADAGVPEAGDGVCTDDGGTLLRCTSHYALHCASSYYAPGATCLQGSNNYTGCALEQNCTAVTSCVGSVLTYCAIDNLKYSINCAYGGYGCGVNEQSGYPCIPPDPTVQCNIPGATRCDSDIVWVCDGLYESAFDCASMGASCSDTEGSARCVMPGSTCSPSDADINVCSGTSIDLCHGGRKSSFDCASIGRTCVPGAQGKSAHCG